MGVRHLKDLRVFLQERRGESFSRTELRDRLKQNYPTILDNLDYLINQGKVVKQLIGSPKRFQWIGVDTRNGKLSEEASADVKSNS